MLVMVGKIGSVALGSCTGEGVHLFPVCVRIPRHESATQLPTDRHVSALLLALFRGVVSGVHLPPRSWSANMRMSVEPGTWL
jgi:hypothetical protein